ncbi:MAG: HAD-IC family P-type ATPase [Gammaproteobacteria bacterium]|nr:HAD-IC family P-type ATPase [Gammaproteobacteria bacterium]
MGIVSYQPDWHAIAKLEVFRALKVGRDGLDEGQARERLKSYGPNQMPRRPPPSVLQIALRQFRSPLIYLLGAAALISIFMHEYKDAAFITGVLVINGLIGTIQETRAERASQALQQLLRINGTVRRNGEVQEVDAEIIVPGDIVYLESGNRVPADIRLVSSQGLEIDESLLTGESVPVSKDADWIGEPGTVQADRKNMAYAGSIIARGRSQGVVVATGASSFLGSLALDALSPSGGKPPLVERMEVFTKRIAIAVLGAAAFIAAVGMLLGGFEIQEMFLFGVALAVSAVPEGLPVAMTVALAIGATRMARRGVIIRQLAAVEGLGSCTLIATDKTGTLTCNELTVNEVRLPDGSVFSVTGQGFAPEGEFLLDGSPLRPDGAAKLSNLARASVLCNEAELHRRDHHYVWRGDPTDVAMLTMAYKLGWRKEDTLVQLPEVNRIPFEPEKQFAATYHLDGEVMRVMVKGAPECVFGMVTDDPVTLDRLRRMAEEMAAAGFRVLGLADGVAATGLDHHLAPPEPTDLRCLGLVGMIDPLRPGVVKAIANVHRAGVRTIMITGDHPKTALAIAQQLGLAATPNQVVTGRELQDAVPEDLPRIIANARVFARVAPHQKLQIVDAARAHGDFVAVTGDGVNDAPALQEANIGVAMGRSGTDVARETAEMVIADDHFATITAGIEEGRIAYDNIRNVIYLLISTGAAEVVLVALALSTGSPLPLLPVQLLWLNLVTNGIQDVALAFESGDESIRWRKPRPPKEPIFNQLMVERTVIAALFMGVVGFGLFTWALANGWSEVSARNALLLLMVLFENVHIFNCRSEIRSVFSRSPLKSPVLMIGMLLAFSVHVAMLYLPIGSAFLATEAVSGDTWILLLSLSLPVLLVMELHKLSWRLRHKN